MNARAHEEENEDEKEILIGKDRRKENIMVPYSVLGIIFAIVVQTMGALWWASGFSSSVSVKLDYLQKGQTELSSAILDSDKSRYTLSDAQKDWAVNEKRLSALEAEVRSFIHREENRGQGIAR